MKKKLWPQIMDFLKSNKNEYSFKQIADIFGSHPKAVGSSMRALYNRGHEDLCRRVKFSDGRIAC